MSVVSRVKVTSVETREWGPTQVKLAPVFASEPNDPPEVVEEIRQFFEASPSGSIELGINNAAAAEQFQPGQHFYMRFEAIPKGS